MPLVTRRPVHALESSPLNAAGSRSWKLSSGGHVKQHAGATMPPESWLLLIHQIPPKPGYLRVKVWRRLQALGAVAIKNSVYALPNTDDAREDFEWVLREIVKEGGEAT